MIKFTDNDIEQLRSKGILKEKVLEQIRIFEDGIPYVYLDRPATIGDGILKLNKTTEKKLIKSYDSARDRFKLLKFVPASGAASRMFKSLFEFVDSYKPEEEDLKSYLEREEKAAMKKFFERLQDFPFYELVSDRLGNSNTDEGQRAKAFVGEMIDSDKLQYDFYPKGLLPFHKYAKNIATAFEEHLKEGALYGSSKKVSRLHFTVSEQHETMFMETYGDIKARLSKDHSVDYIVNFSQQKASTDTLAVTEENTPFREHDGSILFRPGGHGALIENLNEQDADIIFIKNIDNVVVDSFVDEISDSKKVLAGHLINLQEKAFEYARMLDANNLDGEQLKEIKEFLISELNVRFPDSFPSFSISEQIEILRDKIDRPIRICGMVKNEGEPGGGPFWIRDAHGHLSLQIVESAQVDKNDDEQHGILKQSTHFNPVDIVCALRNYKGEKYNLLNFVDTKQGFITDKTKDGRALKALELPGLWNGAMAYWHTVFVEVPLITFNPVKTVNDLLRDQHQPKK